MQGLKLSELKEGNVYYDMLSEMNVLIVKLAKDGARQYGLTFKDGYEELLIHDGQLLDKGWLNFQQPLAPTAGRNPYDPPYIVTCSNGSNQVVQ